MTGGARGLQRLVRAAIALFALTGCASLTPGTLHDTGHPLAGRAWDVAAQQFIEETELLRRAADVDVLLLGETHDNPEHHRLQARILRANLASGARPALLMEQFDTDQQAAIDAARRGGGNLAPLMRGWDWRHYQPLVALAEGARIPLVGANLARTAIRPVVREGYSTLPAGEARRLALEASWDGARQEYMARLIEASHCGRINSEMREGLIRAQRLRDAIMADVVLSRIGTGVVFILGLGHARRDVGVPRYLEARRPGTRMLSIALVEVSGDRVSPAQYDNERVGGVAAYDVIWFTPRAKRADPCAAFGK